MSDVFELISQLLLGITVKPDDVLEFVHIQINESPRKLSFSHTASADNGESRYVRGYLTWLEQA